MDNIIKNTDIKIITKENSLLFEQLNIVQEELEKSYYKLKDYEQHFLTDNDKFFDTISKEIYDALTENIKLQALTKEQKHAILVERQNSLSSKLGNIIINSTNSIIKLIILPLKLCKLWRAFEQTTPPSKLGGKDFSKVIETYFIGGIDAVETLLNSVFISSTMRANAYTALARKLKSSDCKQAVYYARLAWEVNPCAYRLKWLAFRLHESGDSISAEAILSMLPPNINMSDTEKQHAERIYEHSKMERMNITNNMLQKTIKKLSLLNLSIEENKNIQQQLTTELNNLRDRNKYYIQQNNLLTKEIQNLHENHKNELENITTQLNIYKKDFNELAIRTANIIRKLLIEFNLNQIDLIKFIRIITETNNKK